ncbi:carbohydrate-binding module family 1 protein [Peziza echinospora]|nr:carbohydrate-binding module family 1 protein [Peziza echinospora]
MKFLTLAALFFSAASAAVVWDGRFNEFSTSADLNNWSWANQVGPYQYYIHGSGAVTKYVNLSPDYKNPADTVSKQGVKITIDPTALWNSDMWRTELIPQTTANLGTGRLYYHFSVKKTGTNPPNPAYEHQVNFFESHFTELKYGWINGNPTTAPDNNLRWFVGGQSKWNVDWVADVWHNFAYDIDFSAGTVGLWHSTGSNPLVQTVSPISASTSTNSADWHLGILRLPNRSGGTNDQAPEDWYFSGVYIESGSLTTAIGSGTPPPVTSSSTTAAPVSSTKVSTSTKSTSSIKSTSTTSTIKSTTSTTTAAAQPTAVAQKWQQCGGIGYTGPTVCAAGSTCTVSNPYYSQCL